MSAPGATPPGTDRDVLRCAAYADASKLDDRRNLYAFRRPAFDLVDAVLELLDHDEARDRSAGARVLDMGCGPGTYLARLRRRAPTARLVGLDLSVGMLAEARAAGTTALASGDVTSLPFVDAAFDSVMANHMLYHVADIAAAVREARRVLAPGGTFLAVTNALAHIGELDALLASVSGRDGWWRPSHRFVTDDGRSFLDPVFDRVELVSFRGELHVPDAAPVVAFVRSMRDLSGQGYADDEWDRLVLDVDAAVRDVIARDGELVMRTDTGVFVCR